jgi:ribosomal protein S6--L-glutamate ligase
MVFPRVETLLGEHPDMGLKIPDLPGYPFVVKAARGGEGKQVWLVENEDDLQEILQRLSQYELQGKNGFIIQEYLPGLERDLRVVTIGDRLTSYWRKSAGFYHNKARGGEIDAESDPKLQEAGQEAVKKFCRLSGINLAAFDLVFTGDDIEPCFLEINYTFGRSGLGGSEKFYKMLREEVDRWLNSLD